MREANKQNPVSLTKAPAEPGRDALIADAAEAEQAIPTDELEAFAAALEALRDGRPGPFTPRANYCRDCGRPIVDRAHYDSWGVECPCQVDPELKAHLDTLPVFQECGENLDPLGRPGGACSLTKGHEGGHKR